MIEKHSNKQIAQALATLNQQAVEPWCIKDNKLHKIMVFLNFVDAFVFMTKVAFHAEKQNHHPEWFNVYKTVTIDLTTHEVGAVSARGFKLAAVIDELLA